MVRRMNPHSIAAAGQSFDLFATRFCMQAPPPWGLLAIVANAAARVALHTPGLAAPP
jgi:hypothetical protein